MAQSTFDLQGHRGCRGLMPENTIHAFMTATQLGVTTLELDVVISRDSQIVVSHESWMSSVICSHPDGTPVTKEEEMNLNLYNMDYADIQTYDCGMRGHPDFPDQQKFPAVKPTLKQVVRIVERYAAENKIKQPKYNIEIKSDPAVYHVYQPEPTNFVALVLTEMKRLGIEYISTLQSFDVNVLEELHKQPDHKYAISYLVESGKNLKKNLAKLTFKPDIYSPLYTLITEKTIKQCHEQGIRIIPWTVNTQADMDRLKSWGVDGAITDLLIK